MSDRPLAPLPPGTPPEFVAGFIAGLQRAAEFVVAAPTLTPGGNAQTRRADVPGGFPRVADRAKDQDGDPNHVVNTYALPGRRSPLDRPGHRRARSR